MCKLLNELNKKFPNKTFSVLAPIERIDDEEYNQGIQIFINGVIVKCGRSSVISHSINARKNFLYYDNTHSAAASVIPWAFFEESMTPIQMYRIMHQYK